MNAPLKFPIGGVTIAVAQIGPDEHPVHMAYPLTWCCGASGKGGGHGVICRKCYRDVDPMYGDCAPLYGVPMGWSTEQIVGSWVDASDAEVAALVQSWRDQDLFEKVA
ncbi:MAG TPA: hypothetical protein VIT65_10760 [Microlunatus sp.]